jgi:hypothetical protein
MGKRQININTYIIGFCALVILIAMIGGSLHVKEGFGPRWLRTKKNRMMRMVRRSSNPYLSEFYKKLQQFRRKWL